ncbi:ABCB family ABC transporter ATP-binding protein/permease [Thiothrix subterranea]|uniref:ABC transporter ATP-binding protein/permease n=1 Tax=Thiothrix subterranea TaxID=2735563 RepID=A0AA51QYC4_9GAMM|nr:ABC transporter ATP-binding protein/permease [Thiothrix subterranea]MDQ5767020.1 ABC transporter ATP-binding protein/permease [Thiothrix subterranea]WML88118.1 ABC transporter ATP-binding protein/permease [Thiothrix subterranea]
MPPNRTERPDKNRRDWHNLKSVLPFLWEYRGRALFALACLIASKVANVGVPLFLKDIVDGLQGKPEQVLVLPVILLLGYGALRLASALFNELRDTVFARVRYHAMRKMSVRVLEHLHNLSLRFHLERKTGAISRDLERGTASVSTLMNFMVFSIIPIAVEFTLVAVILLGNYAPAFALVTFATVAVYVIFTVKITEWRMDHRHEMNRLDSQSSNQAVDSLINYETVKYFNNEKLEMSRYDHTLAQWEDVAVKSQTSMSLLNFGQSSIIAIGVTIIMFLAANSVVNGTMSIGDLVMVNAFMLQLFLPLGSLGIVYRQVKYTLADMDMVFRLLETPQEVRDAPNATELQVTQGEIRFEHVDFGYQAERQILRGVSFSVPAGTKLAVVGHSGAGKSTLSRLIYRFYDVTGGRVLIDGQDIAHVSQASLRKAIGIVPQDTVLFNDTIRYNLQYGNAQATQAEIERAADMAQIRRFIESLPDGWETVVGERGLKLSGGEKQRVAIARAILKQPPILIFDEATSSLDSATEQAIQQTLHEVAGRHTTLMIAHRLSTIVDADRILVLDKGQVVEQGTHAELLALHGQYFAMWELQLHES